MMMIAEEFLLMYRVKFGRVSEGVEGNGCRLSEWAEVSAASSSERVEERCNQEIVELGRDQVCRVACFLDAVFMDVMIILFDIIG
jgi:hypothetical protein